MKFTIHSHPLILSLFFVLVFPQWVSPQSILSNKTFLQEVLIPNSGVQPYEENYSEKPEGEVLKEKPESSAQKLSISLKAYQQRNFKNLLRALDFQISKDSDKPLNDSQRELMELLRLEAYLHLEDFGALEKYGDRYLEKYPINPLALFNYNYALHKRGKPTVYTEIVSSETFTELEQIDPKRGRLYRRILFSEAIKKQDYYRAMDFYSDEQGVIETSFIEDIYAIAEEVNDLDTLDALLERSGDGVDKTEIELQKLKLLIAQKQFIEAESLMLKLEMIGVDLSKKNERRLASLKAFMRQSKGVLSIKIGVLLPFSDKRLKYYVDETVKGLLLAFDQFKKGDLKIQLTFGDTGGDSVKTSQEVVRLIEEEEVLAIVGPLIKKTSLEAIQTASIYQVPVISLSQSEEVAKSSTYAYRFNASPLEEAEKIANFAVDYLGVKYVAILYTEKPKSIEKSVHFWEVIEDLGASVVSFEEVSNDLAKLRLAFRRLSGNHRFLTSSEDQSIETSGNSTKSQQIDAIYIPSNINNIKLLNDYVKAYGLSHAYILTTSEVNPNQIYLLKNHKKVFNSSSFFEGERFENFYNSYWKEYHINGYYFPPHEYSFYSYMSLKLLREIIVEYGAGTSEAVNKHLQNLKNHKIDNISISYIGNGEIHIPSSIISNQGLTPRALF